MSFLLGGWRYLAVAGLVAVAVGYTYRIGGAAPRAELSAYKAQIAQQLRQAKIAKERADNDYAMELANWQLRFDDVMRKHAARPKPIIAAVCNDAAGNAAVTAAIGVYFDRMACIRDRVAQLAHDAGENENALKCINAWAAGQAAE